MADLRHLLLLLFHTISAFALIIDSSSSSLHQEATNRTSPSRLLDIAPQDRLLNTYLPAANLTQRSPPIHWEYMHDAYRVRLTRKSNGSGSRAQNPGVSLHNWAVAVEEVSSAFESQRSSAGVPWDGQIPGRSFMYAATLKRQREPDPSGTKRRLVFSIFADDLARHGILYEEAWVVLRAYKVYRREWMTVPGGLGNDEVRMARFELFAQGFDDDVRFAYGGVTVQFVPGHSGGLSDLVGASSASRSRVKS